MLTFEEVKQKYIELKELLEHKKQVLIKKDVEELARIDEKLICLYNDIKVVHTHKSELNFTQEEKDQLNNLAQVINQTQKDNEVLILHSLSVINKLFEGILNITSSGKDEYNRLGKKNQTNEFVDISSITEEA